MGKTIMGAVASLDGFIADVNDVGPLFEWCGNDAAWTFVDLDDEFRTTPASADFKRSISAGCGHD